MPYELGRTLTWGLKVYDATGALADLGGGNPTATITKPDATTASGSVTKTATGVYQATYVGGALGRWRCDWTGSGANSGGLPYSDHADVVDLTRAIIPLGDARAALNLTAGNTADDDEIRGVIACVTVLVEHVVGPVLPKTATIVRSGRGKCGIPLDERPASITSVKEDGVTLPASGYCVEDGVLWRGSSSLAGAWSNATANNVEITYAAGSAIVPPNVIDAARDILQHLWSSSQQVARPAFGAPAEVDVATAPVLGWAVPRVALEKLAPSAGGNYNVGLA